MQPQLSHFILCFFYLTMLKLVGRLEVYIATRTLPNSFMIGGKSATENGPLINSPCLLFLIEKVLEIDIIFLTLSS